MDRNSPIMVRLTAPEKKLVVDLAESFGLTISDVVRQLIRREHETRVACKPKKK